MILSNRCLIPSFSLLFVGATIMFKSKPKLSPGEIINKKLERGHQIMPFPHVVGKLLSALRDPNSSAATYAKIIEADAGLTVRLLRLANSPVYGNSHTIQSVSRATTILGNGQLKRIALSFAAKSLIAEGDAAKQRRELLWNHSLGCATVARELAQSVGSTNSDDAFLAAIFHDVGKIFFYDTIPEAYREVESCSGKKLVQRESELFGITHEEVGIKLVTSWQLSEKLMVAVGFHHRPEEAIAHGDFARLIHVADALARQSGIGSVRDPSVVISQEAEERLGLDHDTVEHVIIKSVQKFEATKKSA